MTTKQNPNTTSSSPSSSSAAPSSPTRRFFSSTSKCPSSPSRRNKNNNNKPKKKKQYQAPRGTWNEMPPPPDCMLTNMSPDGPFDSIHQLEYQMWGEEGAPSPPPPLIEEEDPKEKIYLECKGWKLRSGLGKFTVKHAWEERRIVLDGDRLSYYEVVGSKKKDGHDGGVVNGDNGGGGTRTINEALEHLDGTASSSVNECNGRNTSNVNDNDGETKEEFAGDEECLTLHPTEINTESPFTPRGTVLLTTPSTNTSNNNNNDEKNKKEAISIQLSNENTTSSSSSNPMSATAIKNSVKSTVVPSSPTPYAITINIPSQHVHWKFCFPDKATRSKWYAALRAVAGIDENEQEEEVQIHNLEAGDHVVRWEMIMLPVLVWPIQIHGIVLEAGRNCVIIADFGLTSYGPGGGASSSSGNGKRRRDNVPEEEQKKEKEQHDFAMEAWKKLRPKEKKRLNVLVLTDHDEIKKWNKVNYGRNFFKKKGDKGKVMKSIKSIFGGKSSSPHKGKFNLEGGPGTLSKEASSLGVVQEEGGEEEDGLFLGQQIDLEEGGGGDDGGMDDVTAATSVSSYYSEGPKVPIPEFEPDWFREVAEEIDYHSDDDDDEEMERSSSNLNTTSKDAEEEDDDDGNEKSKPPPVFSLDLMTRDASMSQKRKKKRRRRWRGKSKLSSSEEEDDDSSSTHAAHSKLPKSDPTKIVLARTHFVLEHGDELLPPYHVFHSNSECIAVWCKTGRWSTLQTSVFLHSCSVGNAKSSVAFTLGVAATHVFLAPVVALGGVAAVTAPWIILKKSKEKWEAATMKLTEEFWRRAKPEVFVEAIEHWSEIH